MNEKKEYIERGATKFIDADYLLYGMGMFSEKENGKQFVDGVNAVSKLIEETPAADVETVVRGEWEKRELNFGTFYRCSICGETISGFPMYKFCHACGAHMERSGSGE